MNNKTTSLVSNTYWIKIVVIFFLGWVCIYAGRSVFSPIIGEIKIAYDIDNAQAGGIMSLFFLAYTIFQIPAGILGDKIGRKKVLVSGFLLYAAFIASIFFANSFSIFILLWMLAGAAQGTYYGPQYALSTEAIPKKWITLGSAVIGSGMSFGIALGYSLSSVMTTTYHTSWKMPFVVVAIPILLVAFLMMCFVRENIRKKNQDIGEKIIDDINKPSTVQQIISLFKNRNLVLAYITIFCSIYGFFVIITWLPNYLEIERGMDKTEATNLASIVPWISILGTLLCSYASDKLGRRKPVVLFMLPLSLTSIFAIVYSDSYTVLVCVLVLYGFIGKISLNPVLIALVADNVPKTSLSTAFSLYNCIGMSASICAPFITGLISDNSGSLNNGFYFAAFITIVGIVAMLFVKEGDKNK